MKFKVGDKVRVLKSTDDNIEEIKEMIGGIFEVHSVFYNIGIVVYNADKSDSWLFKEDELELIEESRNSIPLIAKELGVKIGQRFKVDTASGIFYFDNEYLNLEIDNEEDIYFAHQKSKSTLEELLNGHWKITERLPKVPRLSEQEYWVLKGLSESIVGIVRGGGELNGLYFTDKIESLWHEAFLFNHLFKFVEKDQEPHNIQELLKEYEEFNESN